MAGLDPANHVLAASDQDVDARDFCADAHKARFCAGTTTEKEFPSWG